MARWILTLLSLTQLVNTTTMTIQRLSSTGWWEYSHNLWCCRWWILRFYSFLFSISQPQTLRLQKIQEVAMRTLLWRRLFTAQAALWSHRTQANRHQQLENVQQVVNLYSNNFIPFNLIYCSQAVKLVLLVAFRRTSHRKSFTRYLSDAARSQRLDCRRRTSVIFDLRLKLPSTPQFTFRAIEWRLAATTIRETLASFTSTTHKRETINMSTNADSDNFKESSDISRKIDRDHRLRRLS